MNIFAKEGSAQCLEEKTSRFQFDVVTVNAGGKEIERKRGIAKYFPEDLGNGVTLDMVAIPGGSFLMGSPKGEGNNDEKPQHQVNVSDFFMGKFPVTQAQWKAIASLPKVDRVLQLDPSWFEGDNRPVEHVSWYDAVEFCKRLSRETRREYRLPSEAEWEYAIRAGTTTPFHFGETIKSDLANYAGNRGETTDVGSFPPNAFGLCDMHGQLWEWCADNWHENYKGAPTDGSAWLTQDKSLARVIRGGGWNYDRDQCRSACRYSFAPRIWNVDLGFRVACAASRSL